MALTPTRSQAGPSRPYRDPFSLSTSFVPSIHSEGAANTSRSTTPEIPRTPDTSQGRWTLLHRDIDVVIFVSDTLESRSPPTLRVRPGSRTIEFQLYPHRGEHDTDSPVANTPRNTIPEVPSTPETWSLLHSSRAAAIYVSNISGQRSSRDLEVKPGSTTMEYRIYPSDEERGPHYNGPKLLQAIIRSKRYLKTAQAEVAALKQERREAKDECVATAVANRVLREGVDQETMNIRKALGDEDPNLEQGAGDESETDEQKLKNLGTASERLQAENVTLQQQNSTLTAESNRHREQITQLQQQNLILTEESNMHREQATQLQQQNVILTRRQRWLRRRNFRLQTARTRLQRQNDTLRRQRNRLRFQRNNVTRERDVLQETNEELTRQLADTNTQYEAQTNVPLDQNEWVNALAVDLETAEHKSLPIYRDRRIAPRRNRQLQGGRTKPTMIMMRDPNNPRKRDVKRKRLNGQLIETAGNRFARQNPRTVAGQSIKFMKLILG